MKISLFGSIGFLFLMSIAGCSYHAGTYDPCSGCAVGSGWSLGCSNACPPAPTSCGTYQTPGCQAPVYQEPGCQAPSPGCQAPTFQPTCSTGYYHGNNTYRGGCYGSHSGRNLHRLNPANWVKYAFGWVFLHHRYRRYYKSQHGSSSNFFCSPACASGCETYGNNCQTGNCEIGSFSPNMYQESLQSTPAPHSPPAAPAVAPQPVTYQHQYPYHQSVPSKANSYTILPASATFVKTPHWAATKR